MNIATIVKKNSITIYLGSRIETIDNEHPNFEDIKLALVNKEYDGLDELINIPLSIQNYSFGTVLIKDGEIFLGGESLHTSLAKRILQMKSEGFPFENMVKFLENLYANPSKNSVDQLYAFLEHKGLPITDDGHFLAYKVVKSDYTDKYSGKIDNSVGKVVTMPRNQVADDYKTECSYGLHCGAMDYINWYGNGTTDKILVVKVNPSDAVSVPHDHNHTKLRVCRYEVISELENSSHEYTKSVVATAPAPVVVPEEPELSDEDEEFLGEKKVNPFDALVDYLKTFAGTTKLQDVRDVTGFTNPISNILNEVVSDYGSATEVGTVIEDLTQF